jgi:predicted nuclease of predicted toxin-antitoxin system
MKVLLDENLPKRLKRDFSNVEIYTVRDKSWNGKRNGELLQLMLNEKFDVLITFDKNLEHQQNFAKFPISVFVLNAHDNTYETLSGLIPKIKTLFTKPLQSGVIEIK